VGRHPAGESLRGRTGRGVSVAVVDSGIDPTPGSQGKVRDSVEAVIEDGRIDFRPSTSAIKRGMALRAPGLSQHRA